MSMFFIFGILFLWYSQHKKSFEKTAADQGLKTAENKFRVIKLCGYLLIIGAVAFGIFIIIDI